MMIFVGPLGLGRARQSPGAGCITFDAFRWCGRDESARHPLHRLPCLVEGVGTYDSRARRALTHDQE